MLSKTCVVGRPLKTEGWRASGGVTTLVCLLH
jgi:hypothetical protein